MQEPILIALHGARGAGKDTTYDFIAKWCAKFDPALSAVRGSFADNMKWAYMRMWVPTCTKQFAIDFIDQWKNDPEATCAGIFADEDGILTGDSRLEDREDITGQEDEDSPLYFIPPVNFRDHMNQFATESAREVYGDNHWVDMLLPESPTDKNPEGWRGHFLVPPRTAEEDPYSFAHYAVITDVRAENELARVARLGGLNVKIRRRDAEIKQRAYYEERGEDPHMFSRELPDGMFDVVLVNDDNSMEQSYLRTNLMMDEVHRNGVASIKRGQPIPWRI